MTVEPASKSARPPEPGGWGTLLLLAAIGALFLPSGMAALGVVLVAVGWTFSRPSRQDRWFVLPGLALVAGCLVLAAWYERAPILDFGLRPGVLEGAYDDLWRELEETAEQTANSLEEPPQSVAESEDPDLQLAMFQHLQELSTQARPGLTLFLLDANGEAYAWAGDGLLHEPSQAALPREGLAWRHGYTAVTLYAVVPLGEPRRPWRVVCGRSLATDQRPLPPLPAEIDWALGPADTEVGPERLAVARSGSPTLFLTRPAAPAHRQHLAKRWQRLAAGGLGLILIALGTLRGPRRSVHHRMRFINYPQTA